MDSSTEAPRFLAWNVKASLLAYVRGMPDGSVEAATPARLVGDVFHFPLHAELPSGELRFSGALTLQGHGGMLRLRFADFALVPSGGGKVGADPCTITIADPFESESRLELAEIAESRVLPDGTVETRGTSLTEAGSDLFFSGPYTTGTPLDDPRVVILP